MNTHFSEHRLLSQRMPEASRQPMNPEAMRQATDLGRVMADLNRTFEEFARTMTPEQKAAMGRVAHELGRVFVQTRGDFFGAMKQELPRLGQYLNVGGQYGVRAPGVQWNPQQQMLQLDQGMFRLPQQNYQVRMQPHQHSNLLVLDQAGQASFIDVFGEDEEDDFSSLSDLGASSILDADGIHQIDDIFAQMDNRFLDQNVAQLGTQNRLNDLRQQMPQQPAQQNATVQPQPSPQQRAGNLPLRPGETKEGKRAELQAELAKAKQDFEQQKTVLANAPTDRKDAERQKLIQMELDIAGIEGQIKALDGGTQANPVVQAR